MSEKKQDNKLIRLIRLLEEAGYLVLKAEIVQEPTRWGYIDLTICKSDIDDEEG